MSSQEQQQSEYREGEGEEEEDSLHSASHKAKQYMNRAQISRPDNNTILIYSILIILSITLLYFNFNIYRKYNQHHTLMQIYINSTNNQIKFSKNEVINKINTFMTEYSTKYEQINEDLQESYTMIQRMRNQSDHQLDQLQILKNNNTQDQMSINKTIKQHQIYAKQIKKYLLSDLQTRTMKNSYFDPHHQRIKYSNIQSIVWVFTQTYPTQNQYLKKLYLHNVKYYAYISNFDFRVITPNNYFYYLSPDMVDKVTQIVSKLEIRLSNHDRTNLGDHFETIKKVIFMFSVLYQNGGVAIIDDLALTQPLNWLHDIDILKTFNHKNHQIPPQVIGFLSPFYSSFKMDLSGQGEREFYQFPDLQRFFVAAIKKSKLIGQMLDEMIRILENPFSIKDQIIDEGYDMGWLTGKDPYYQFYFIASHLVLQKKQRELSLSGKKTYAVDYYGLYSLNSALGPNKLKSFFTNENKAYKQNNLLDITKKQLENKIGRIQYIHIFNDYSEANRLLLDVKNRKRNMLKDCFIDQLFYPAGSDKDLTYNRIENYQGRNRFKLWGDLPKKIWIYQVTDQNNLVGKLMMNIQSKMHKAQGFEVRTFDSKTIESLLAPQIVKQVKQIFANSIYSSHTSMKQYVLMLCLLSKEGGIFFDSSYFLLESLEWLYNINQINDSMVFNRFGDSPQIFMFHNQHLRNYFSYSFDHMLHTRIDTHLIYDKSFLAVSKDSQLLDQWIEDILKTLPMNNSQLNKKFAACGLNDEVQYRKNNDYLPIDILRCLYAKGLSKMPRENYNKASNHYRLWSIDGDYSIYKINANTNYENVEMNKNIYTAKQSQQEVQSKIGPIFKLIKLDQPNYNYLNELYISNGKSQYKLINRNSLISKYFMQRNT